MTSPSSRALVVNQSILGSREPTLLCNQVDISTALGVCNYPFIFHGFGRLLFRMRFLLIAIHAGKKVIWIAKIT